jgi:hypothetical protein
MKLIDLTGQSFGRLIVIERAEKAGHDEAHWMCACSCGQTKVILGNSLRRGVTTSCGCRARQVHRARLLKHGGKGTAEYRTWRAMKNRCLNPNSQDYENYGGRGIAICPEWRGDFGAFLAHVGLRPGSGYSIDRIDVNGNYEPGNVRWATASEQRRNQRSLKAEVLDGAEVVAA